MIVSELSVASDILRSEVELVIKVVGRHALWWQREGAQVKEL